MAKNLCPIWTPLHLHRRALYLAVRRLILEGLPAHSQRVQRQLDVLDVGCGSQPYKAVFDEVKVCRTYHGADVDARSHVSVRINPETEQIETASESYDVVVHFQVLEHVPSPQFLLEECFRVLRPGGVMLCTVPFLFEYHAVPGDYHRWTDQGLQHDVIRAGFKCDTTWPVETELESVLTLLELIIARRLGYVWTKPLFLAGNLLGRALPFGRTRVFTLTHACEARKPE